MVVLVCKDNRQQQQEAVGHGLGQGRAAGVMQQHLLLHLGLLWVLVAPSEQEYQVTLLQLLLVLAELLLLVPMVREVVVAVVLLLQEIPGAVSRRQTLCSG